VTYYCYSLFIAFDRPLFARGDIELPLPPPRLSICSFFHKHNNNIIIKLADWHLAVAVICVMPLTTKAGEPDY
jgi:hypothetical protein